MNILASDLSKRILLSISLSAAAALSLVASPAAAQLRASPVRSCSDIFVSRSGLADSRSVLNGAELKTKQVEMEAVDDEMVAEMDLARLQLNRRVLKMSDAEFAVLAKPHFKVGERFENSVTKFGSKAKALEVQAFRMDPRAGEFFDEQGHILFSKLPRLSLSLENGRQKLDFARIHFSKRDEALATLLLKDYLNAAVKVQSLKLLVVTDQPIEKLETILSRYSKDVRSRVQVVETDKTLWIWAQDGSKPIDLPKASLELNGPRYKALNDSLGETKHLDMRNEILNYMQGGNIIVGDRAVFVGPSELDALRFFFHTDEAGALEILTYVFQKPVHLAQLRTFEFAGAQWTFHIDLDLVLAVDRNSNREVALVRSPQALLNSLSGLTLSSDPSVDELNEVKKVIFQRYRSGFFGKSLNSGSREFIRTLSTWSNSKLQLVLTNALLFKRSIALQGFETRDLPGFGEAQLNGEAQSVFFGTNAVLTGRYAFVPGNKMPELDSLVAKIYEDLGYEVLPMRSSSETICKDGGIRCVTETYRKPYLTSAPAK